MKHFASQFTHKQQVSKQKGAFGGLLLTGILTSCEDFAALCVWYAHLEPIHYSLGT